MHSFEPGNRLFYVYTEKDFQNTGTHRIMDGMNRTSAKILLFFVFAARGTSFLFSKILLTDMEPMSIMAIRFLLAFFVLAVVFHRKMLHISRASLRGGLVLGALYTVCMGFEMYALQMIDSGICAVIENMAIVIVPVIMAIFTRTLPKKKTILCAVIAFVGVVFLSLEQSKINGGLLGLVLSLLAAVAFAFCIIATEKVRKEGDPITIGILQLGTMGILTFVFSLFQGGFRLPQTGMQWVMMLLLVFLCSCFGFAFQPVGQKYVSAETAAVFTVVNPLTASIMGILIAGEGLSPVKVIGYVLVLAALIMYNLQGTKKRGLSE